MGDSGDGLGVTRGGSAREEMEEEERGRKVGIGEKRGKGSRGREVEGKKSGRSQEGGTEPCRRGRVHRRADVNGTKQRRNAKSYRQ